MKKTLIALAALSGIAAADMVQLSFDEGRLELVSSITPATMTGGNSKLTIDTVATEYTAPLTDYMLTFQFTSVSNYATDAFIRMGDNNGLCVHGNADGAIFITSSYNSTTPLGGTLAGDTTSTFALTVSASNNVAHLSNLSTGEVVTLSDLNSVFTNGKYTFTNDNAATRFYCNGDPGAQQFKLGQVANLRDMTTEQVFRAAKTGVIAPEPATVSLSLLAFAGLAARRRRH